MNRLLEISAAEAYVKFYQKQIPLVDYKLLTAMDPVVGKSEFEARQKGPYVDWLLKQYKSLSSHDKKNFLSEDAEQITQGLELFHKLSRSVRGAALLAQIVGNEVANVKDINSYELASIRMIAAHQDQLTGEETPLEKRIKVIMNGEVLFVCVPETHEAARKYGTGTNWCTATSNPGHYDRYSKKGPLFIIIDKKNSAEKWQFHKDDFRDRKDSPVTPYGWLRQMEQKGEAYAEEADQLAEIFAEHFRYRAWTSEKLISEWTAKIKDGVKHLQSVSRDDLEFVTIDGYSALAYFLLNDNTPMVELLLESDPTLEASAEDLKTMLVGRFIPADVVRNLLGHMNNKNVFQAFYQAHVTRSSSSPLVAAMVNTGRGEDVFDRIQLLHTMFARMAESVPFSRRALLATSAGRQLFPASFIKWLSEAPDGDDTAYDLVTTLYPELVSDEQEALKERYLFGGMSRKDYEQKYADEQLSKAGILSGKTFAVEDVRKVLLKSFTPHLFKFPKTRVLLGGGDTNGEDVLMAVQALLEHPLDYESAWFKVTKTMGVRGKAAPGAVLAYIQDRAEDLDWIKIRAAVKPIIEESLAAFAELAPKEEPLDMRSSILAALRPLRTVYYWEVGAVPSLDWNHYTSSPSVVRALGMLYENLNTGSSSIRYTAARGPEVWPARTGVVLAKHIILPAFQELGLHKQQARELYNRVERVSQTLQYLTHWYEVALKKDDVEAMVAPLHTIVAKLDVHPILRAYLKKRADRLNIIDLGANPMMLGPSVYFDGGLGKALDWGYNSVNSALVLDSNQFLAELVDFQAVVAKVFTSLASKSTIRYNRKKSALDYFADCLLSTRGKEGDVDIVTGRRLPVPGLPKKSVATDE